MPAKSEAQQRAFSMALAVRHGKMKRSEVDKSVLDIVDSDMTDAQLRHYTKLNESYRPTKLSEYIYHQRYANRQTPDFTVDYNPNYVFVVIKPGFIHLTSTILTVMKKNGFSLYKTRPKKLTLNEAKSMYRMHEKEKFYNDLCKYMSSDTSLGILFTYKGQDKFKKLDAIKDEIRKKYSESDMRNVMHSSDSDENMKNEMLKYFSAI